MKKEIIIDIQKEEDLIEKYNCNIANYHLIEYILKRTIHTKKDDEIEIIIHNKCNTKIDIKEKIIEGLKLQYELLTKEHERTNKLQIVLLILGVLLLFLSTLTNDQFVWKELILIIGWVPIWEMVDIELFKERKGIKTKKAIKKLLKSEIKIEN